MLEKLAFICIAGSLSIVILPLFGMKSVLSLDNIGEDILASLAMAALGVALLALANWRKEKK